MVCGLRAGIAPLPARSAQSGPWSSLDTWEAKRKPAPGGLVEIRPGHTVTYDVKSDDAIRMVHVLGTLSFAHDRDTRINFDAEFLRQRC